MANQVFSRLFPKTLTLTAIYSRSLSTTSSSSSSPISFLRRIRPLSGAVITSRPVLLPPSFRSLSTGTTIPSLIEQPSPNATALKLRNGYNYYRCLVIMRARYIDRFIGLFRGEPKKEEIIDSYVKTLAGIVGSEDEARMMVYSGTKMSKNKYAFGTLIPAEHHISVEALPRVVMILHSDPFFYIKKNIDEIPIHRLEQMVTYAQWCGDPLGCDDGFLAHFMRL